MSKSNSSLAVVIQEGMTIGMKTSICEMVKTKARNCSSLGAQSSQAKKIPAEIKSQSNPANKELLEKVLKDGEAKIKATFESAEGKKANNEHVKLNETLKSGEKNVPTDVAKNVVAEPAVVNNRNKISALVNAKNSIKIKSLAELKKCEEVNKSNESEASKPVKRKYVKKKKSEDALDVSKNSSTTASKGAARGSDKIDQNKSNCVNISDVKCAEIKSASKADTRLESKAELVDMTEKINESVAEQLSEMAVKPSQNKAKTVAKSKSQLQEGSKVHGLSSDEKMEDTKVDAGSASKAKRKYVKKVKAIQSDADDKLSKPQENTETQKPIKMEHDASSDATESKKETDEYQKNETNNKKLKDAEAAINVDVQKSPEKVTKPTTPKKDVKVESQEKLTKGKTLKSKVCDKKLIEKQSKLSPKKQNIEVKQEEDPLQISSCESENSSNSSDSDSELTEDCFKKPSKPLVPRNLRNKKPKLVIVKRSRVASLNAKAKVHCLYENEARSVVETNISKAARKPHADGSSDEDDDKSVIVFEKR
jgi:hypothetical protein